VNKLIFIILSLLVVSSAAPCQEPAPTLARDRLLGPVKTVEYGRIGYVLSDERWIESKKVPIQKLTFDEQGNRTESINYQANGQITEKLVYTYDALGRNTGYEEHYNPESKTYTGPRRHTFNLDENGRVVEFILYEANGTIGDRFTYKYDAKGNKLEEVFYSWTGARIGRLVYTYDGAGHRITETSYNRDDDASAWNNTTSYDAEGRMTEWVQYQNGVLRYKKLFKFDSQGRIAEEETFEFNGSPNIRASHAPVPGKVVHTYNDRERSEEIATYAPDGALNSRVIRRRDEKGNELSSEYFNSDGSRRNTEIGLEDPTRTKLVGRLSGKALIRYEYDSQGNWIRKTNLILEPGAKEPQSYNTEYRDIKYFNNK
jgi:YD repeat-containing protein